MINRLHFSIDIEAEKEKIWKALWDLDMYKDWAGIFFEGSYAVTNNWEEGSRVLFLAPDKSGIYSNVETHIPNKTITFKHIGTVVEGKEQPIDDDTKKWSGTTETYTIVEGENYNTLRVDIDILDEHLDFMNRTFPIALERVKQNCM